MKWAWLVVAAFSQHVLKQLISLFTVEGIPQNMGQRKNCHCRKKKKKPREKKMTMIVVENSFQKTSRQKSVTTGWHPKQSYENSHKWRDLLSTFDKISWELPWPRGGIPELSKSCFCCWAESNSSFCSFDLSIESKLDTQSLLVIVTTDPNFLLPYFYLIFCLTPRSLDTHLQDDTSQINHFILFLFPPPPHTKDEWTTPTNSLTF